MMNSEEKIKDELQKLLEKDNLDYSKFLELSNKLIKFDTNNIRFSVDAGVISRLGKELVARPETAVSELIKNAYDADAIKVELFYENSDQLGGTLTIVDNGHGMTKEQLINGYMRISSTDKIHNPISPKYKRKRAGRKGIGRFATQRLGKKLTIITQTQDSKTALKLTINWDDFQIDKDLFSIANDITKIPPKDNSGTTLIIENLRDIWTETQIKRVYKYSSDILQPYPLSKENKKNKNKLDPGFKAYFYQIINNQTVIIADEDTMLFKFALAEIEGFVDENGHGFYVIISKKLDLDEFLKIGRDRDKEDSPFLFLRNIHFKAYYFIYLPDLIPRQSLTMIREAGNDYGGIKLYRNGFRVLPYGEKNNDWLGLDESVRERHHLFPHGNNNFFGFVEIIDKDETQFEELSSREGISNNQTFNELIDFIFKVLISTTARIAGLRQKKQRTGQHDWHKKEKPSEKIREFANDVKNLTQFDNKKEEWNKQKEEIYQNLNDAANDFEEYEKQLIDENSLLRVLAGLGLTMAEFIHEIKNYVHSFGADIDSLSEFAKSNNKVMNIINGLNFNYNAFSSYTSYFDKIISRNVSREIEPIEIRDAINDFLDVIKQDKIKAGIEILKPEYNDYDLFTTPMHPSEIASILFNFYTNSKKAIKKTKNKGCILIRAGKQNRIIYLEFHDNGIGIPKENKDKIFDAFFTTSSPAGHSARYFEEILGTGLGLKIVRDIVNSYNGEVFVNTPHKDFVTCLRIELPAATEEEIKNHGL